jgi:hypothetical protein
VIAGIFIHARPAPKTRGHRSEGPIMPTTLQPVPCLLLAAAIAAVAVATTAPARAASADEAMKWLSGRWTSDGNCKGAWISFDRKGAGWTYRELAYDKGKPFPATSTTDAAGVMTVNIMVPDGVYVYVNTFRDRNSFDATETFNSATVKGEPSTKSYTRCK